MINGCVERDVFSVLVTESPQRAVNTERNINRKLALTIANLSGYNSSTLAFDMKDLHTPDHNMFWYLACGLFGVKV